jgi:hypothetical protein
VNQSKPLSVGGAAPLQTYRLPPQDIYRCERCPAGGVCNGLPAKHIVIDPGTAPQAHSP